MMAADSSTLAGLLSAGGGERPAVVVPERELTVSRTELSHDVWRLAECLSAAASSRKNRCRLCLPTDWNSSSAF